MAVSPMERQVLRLLHRARKPGALAAMSVPVGALEQIVNDALAGDDARTVNLRRAIFEADFKRTATNAELARRSGVSLRHFQRWRAEAVASIARHAAGSLGSIQAPRPPRTGPCWRFRREVAAFVAARDRGNALEMRCIATNMMRLAGDAETQTLAQAYLGDANRRLGITEERLALDRGVPRVRGSRCLETDRSRHRTRGPTRAARSDRAGRGSSVAGLAALRTARLPRLGRALRRRAVRNGRGSCRV